MSEFVVYTVPGSPYGRAVLATLEEKRAPYRVIRVAPDKLRQQEHLVRQPFARVPAIEHDGFALYETQAILRYVDRLFPAPSLTPTNVQDAARMDQLMNINDWYLFSGAGDVIVYERIVKQHFMGLSADEAAIAEALPKARQVLAELARLLGDRPFFVSDALSLADLLIGPQLDILSETPEWSGLSAPHRTLVDWLARMQARDSFIATTMDRVIEKAAA